MFYVLKIKTVVDPSHDATWQTLEVFFLDMAEVFPGMKTLNVSKIFNFFFLDIHSIIFKYEKINIGIQAEMNQCGIIGESLLQSMLFLKKVFGFWK